MQKIRLFSVICLMFIIVGCEFFTSQRMIIPENVVTRASFDDLIGTYNSTPLGRGEGSKTEATLKITDSGKTETLENGQSIDLLDIEYIGNNSKPKESFLGGTLALSELPKQKEDQSTLYIASVYFDMVGNIKQKEKKYFFFIAQKDYGKSILAFWMPNSESQAIKDIAKGPQLLPPDMSFKVKRQNTQSTVQWARTHGRNYVKFDKPFIFQK